jgi:hypothetical protein
MATTAQDISTAKGAKGDRKGAKGDHKGGKGGRKGGKGDRKGAKGDRDRKGGKGAKGSKGGGYYDEYYDEPIRRELHCSACEWAGKPWRVYSKHDATICSRYGGGMEGYHLDDCIAEQQRPNRQHYEQKREHDWPQAKAARTDTDHGEIANDKAEAGGAEEKTEETNSAIMERWYGMHGQSK